VLTTLKTLQWHSDPQRQSALEDWAIEKMIAVYNQFFPQTKSTIAELIRLFAASKFPPLKSYLIARQKTPLTTAEFEYLGNLTRIRDIRVEDFMLSPSWFNRTKEKDVREIARFVVESKEGDIRKRNWRLYKFAMGRSPKVDARAT